MSKKQRAQEELKKMMASKPATPPAPERPMDVKHTINELRFIDESGVEQTLSIPEIKLNHFEFVKEKFLYLQIMEETPDVEKIKAGMSYPLKMMWIPFDKIISFKATRRLIFFSDTQVETFVKENTEFARTEV